MTSLCIQPLVHLSPPMSLHFKKAKALHFKQAGCFNSIVQPNSCCPEQPGNLNALVNKDPEAHLQKNK